MCSRQCSVLVQQKRVGDLPPAKKFCKAALAGGASVDKLCRILKLHQQEGHLLTCVLQGKDLPVSQNHSVQVLLPQLEKNWQDALDLNAFASQLDGATFSAEHGKFKELVSV